MRNASAAKKEGNGIKKRKSKQERRFFLLGLLFVSPWLIGFLCFQLYPILSALYYSFTDFNIFQPAEFTGLDNYVTLFNDKYFPVSIKNTAVMSFIGMPIGLVVALALAVLLSKEVKGMPAFRTIYYLPTVVPIVASAMLFLWVLNPEYGLLNNFLSWFGIRGPSWLSDPKFTKISLMIMDVWRCGQNTVIFLSALKAVPKSFYEAAELDGANTFQFLMKIVLPLSKPIIAVIALYYAVGHWNDFFTALIYLNDKELMPLQSFLRDLLMSNKMSLNNMQGLDAAQAEAKMQLSQTLKYSAIIVSTVPVLCIYPFIQKYFVKGVMIGSVKG